MNDWHLFDSTAELDIALTDYLGQRLQTQVNDSGRASLAVSGGNTPKGLFRGLSHYPATWPQVDVTLVDERWVATDSDQSNERLVREELLQNRAADANFIGLKCDTANAELGVAETSQKLADLQRPFSAVVLGMGEDGHTASWFPQASNLQTLLDPAAPAFLAATDPVTAPHQRLTLTLAAVLVSKEIIIHITGATKRAVLQSAQDKHLPVAAILRQTKVPVSIWWAP
ncbi:MAG: 6-phosphogluconolactonase [Halieaceae bacterium]